MIDRNGRTWLTVSSAARMDGPFAGSTGDDGSLDPIEQLRDDVLDRKVFFDTTSSGLGEPGSKLAVAHRLFESVRQRGGVVGGHHDACAALQQLGDAAGRGRNHGHSVCHGFEQRDGDSLVVPIAKINAGQDNCADAFLPVEIQQDVVRDVAEERNPIVNCQRLGQRRKSSRSGPSPARDNVQSTPCCFSRRTASRRQRCPFTGIRWAAQRRFVALAAVNRPDAGGSVTPMWITAVLPGTRQAPRFLASLSPLREIYRTNEALFSFVASRLLATMSPRCAVKLHGIPDNSAAAMAIVAMVDAQCAWIWSAFHVLARRANHNALGSTAKLRALTPTREVRSTAAVALVERNGLRRYSATATATISGEMTGFLMLAACKFFASPWTALFGADRGTISISCPRRIISWTSGITNDSSFPYGSSAVTYSSRTLTRPPCVRATDLRRISVGVALSFPCSRPIERPQAIP